MLLFRWVVFTTIFIAAQHYPRDTHKQSVMNEEQSTCVTIFFSSNSNTQNMQAIDRQKIVYRNNKKWKLEQRSINNESNNIVCMCVVHYTLLLFILSFT